MEVFNSAREASRAAAATIHRGSDADRGKVTEAECAEILNRADGTLALTPRTQVAITEEYVCPNPGSDDGIIRGIDFSNPT